MGTEKLPEAKEASARSAAGADQDATNESGEGYGQAVKTSSGPHPDLLDWEQAAERLRCSRSTLKRIKARGDIGFTTVGVGRKPRVYFHPDDIETYLESQRHAVRRGQS